MAGWNRAIFKLAILLGTPPLDRLNDVAHYGCATSKESRRYQLKTAGRTWTVLIAASARVQVLHRVRGMQRMWIFVRGIDIPAAAVHSDTCHGVR